MSRHTWEELHGSRATTRRLNTICPSTSAATACGWGFDVTHTRTFWMSISHFLPGGGAEEAATPVEKVYFVIEGEVTIKTPTSEVTLRKYDSCYLAPNEPRSIENRTKLPSTMLVSIPYPEPREFDAL